MAIIILVRASVSIRSLSCGHVLFACLFINHLVVLIAFWRIAYCKVDYQEKQFAQGVIPNTFMRREGAPKERELLCGRIIDRPIRPLFPAGFYHEVQVRFRFRFRLFFIFMIGTLLRQ